MSGLLVARRGSPHRSRAASADYAAEVLADSPFAYWRFEETSGSTVADEVGSNDGTVFGANLNVSGLAATGSAASFDGTDDYINVGTLGTFGDSIGSSSYEFFAKWTDTTANMRFLGVANGGTSIVIQFKVNVDINNDPSAGRVQFFFRHADSGATNGDTRIRASASAGWNDGNWHHFVVTWAGAPDYPDIYVDGTLDNGATSESVQTARGGEPFDYPLTLGVLNSRGSLIGYYNGELDEVALYDKVLAPARILAHAQAAGVA